MKSSKEALKAFCQYYWTYPSKLVNDSHLDGLKQHHILISSLADCIRFEIQYYNNASRKGTIPPIHKMDTSDAIELATILLNQFN